MTVEAFTYIPAADLPPARLARAQHWALEVALRLDASVVLLGTLPDECERVVLCTCGCQRGTDGSMVVVPDLLVLTGIAAGADVGDHEVITRIHDHRSGMIIREWRDG